MSNDSGITIPLLSADLFKQSFDLLRYQLHSLHLLVEIVILDQSLVEIRFLGGSQSGGKLISMCMIGRRDNPMISLISGSLQVEKSCVKTPLTMVWALIFRAGCCVDEVRNFLTAALKLKKNSSLKSLHGTKEIFSKA